MDESRYLELAGAAFKRIDRALADVDPEDVDCELAGDVLTLTFPSGSKCIVNTQRPTRQIWVAANARAWHFAYDEGRDAWFDDKGEGLELFGHLHALVARSAGPGFRVSQF